MALLACTGWATQAGAQATTQQDTVVAKKELADVAVVAKISATNIEPGKIIYNTKDLPVATAGTAGDILKNMPSVAMGGSPNHNRDIRLRGLGNGYTQVLINGRASGISGNNRETVLDQIPASAIDYIEILTNPTAEYQADGINGIVNIVLKKGYSDGPLKGSLAFYADNTKGYNGSLALGQQKGKFEYQLSYDRLQRTINNDKFSEKINYKNGAYDGTQTTDQREDKSFLNENARVEAKYRPWKSGTFTGSMQFGRQLEEKTKTIGIYTTKADSSYKDRSSRTEPEDKDNKFYEYVLDYRHNFKNSGSLKASVSYLRFNQPKTKNINSQALNDNGSLKGTPTMQEETEMLIDDNYFATLDYTLPLGQRHKLKAGYRLAALNRDLDNSLAIFNSANGQWETSQSNQNNFIFRENTHALYVTDEFRWKFLRLTAGMRAEKTYLDNESPVDKITKTSNYTVLLPNFSAQFTLDSTQYITMGFGKRVRRPAFKDLSPFVDNRDPLKIKEGNPDLKPEYSYNYELGYLKNFKHFNVGANLFYRDINSLIQKVITEDDNGVQYEKPDNFTGAYLWGIELMGAAKIASWWTLNASYSYFDSKITDPLFSGDALKDQLKYSAKIITDFRLPFNTGLQVAANYFGPKPAPQESEKELYFVDMAIEKTFLKNGRILLRVTDLFDSVVKNKTITTDKSVAYETENTRGRIITAGIKWNF